MANQSIICSESVNGFFEWKKEGKTKVPYWVHSTEDDFFALAGIWDQWNDQEGVKSLLCCSARIAD